MSEKKQTELYKRISITENALEGGVKYRQSGPDAPHVMQKRMSFLYKEAESYRVDFLAHCDTRIQSMHTMAKRDDVLGAFWEPTPSRMLMHILYSDMVQNRATKQNTVTNSLYVSDKTAGGIINHLVERGAVVKRRCPDDRRTTFLIPTIDMLIHFERQMAHFFIRSNYFRGHGSSTMIIKLIQFDACRKKHFSKYMYNLTKFEIPGFIRRKMPGYEKQFPQLQLISEPSELFVA